MKKTLFSSVVLLSALSAGCTDGYELAAAKKRIAELEDENSRLKSQAGETKPGSSRQASTAKESAAPANLTGKQWVYESDEDKMTGGTRYFATVKSVNTVEFDFPYKGAQHGRLQLRIDPKHGKDLIFFIEKGQLMCNAYQGCNVLVRFDDEKPIKYSGIGPSDGSRDTIFLRNYEQFFNKLKKATIVRISADTYKNGSPVFEFDVSGFDPEKYRSKNKTSA